MTFLEILRAGAIGAVVMALAAIFAARWVLRRPWGWGD